MANKTLQEAKRQKNDEFYTQLVDIEQELKHYKQHFEGKTVLCNCDDPYESNFFRYFALNFNALKLKKLIATSYDTSPIAYTQLDIFGGESAPIPNPVRRAYKVEITEVADFNDDGATDLGDVEYLLRNKANTLTLLKGNGDFRSEECIALLKEADIVVTNPPFSLFRDYVAQLMEYEKKFVIIGNKNAITYKEIFPLIKENKLWTGYRGFSGGMWFYSDYDGKTEKTIEGRKLINVPSIWFTNLDHAKRHEELILYKRYYGHEDDYIRYDNYDAIEVSKVSDIPYDYVPTQNCSGDIGVQITFLDKHNPDQFEIV